MKTCVVRPGGVYGGALTLDLLESLRGMVTRRERSLNVEGGDYEVGNAEDKGSLVFVEVRSGGERVLAGVGGLSREHGEGVGDGRLLRMEMSGGEKEHRDDEGWPAHRFGMR